MIRRLLEARRTPATAPATIPPGQRVYAIGDIHGRLDLLQDLLDQIASDDATRGHAETTLIFLGDLIDRGPQSADVIEQLRLLAALRPNTRFILGNHEEMFLHALVGDMQAISPFCRYGGRETILSYGIAPYEYEGMDYAALSESLDELVPATHRAFLAGFEDLIVIGDYAFVHAGIRPGVALSEQKPEDLRWIREPFLSHRGALEKVIVHGHTIAETVEIMPHRIGIDTGAYASETLTALGLEGEARWLLQTQSVEREIGITQSPFVSSKVEKPG